MTDEQIGLGQGLSDADIGLGTEPSLGQQAIGGLKRGFQAVQPIAQIPQMLAQKVSDLVMPALREVGRYIGPEAFRGDPGENVQLAPRVPGLDPTDAMFAMNRPVLTPGLPPFAAMGTPPISGAPVSTQAIERPLPDLPTPMKFGGAILATGHELMPFAAGGGPLADVVKAYPELAKVAAIYFGMQAPQSIQQRFAQAQQEGGGVGEYTKAALGSAVDVAAPLGLASLRAPEMRSGIHYEDIPGRRSADIPIDDDMVMKQQVGPERQLVDRSPPEPPRGEFAVTPSGRTLDVSRATPAEVSQFMVNPKSFIASQAQKLAKAEPSTGARSETTDLSERTRLHSGLLADFEDYTRLVGEMRTAIAAKDFDKVYELQGQTEVIKGRHGGMPPKEPTSVNDLRPAVKVGERTLVGEPGDTHAMVLERSGVDPESIPHADPRRGFVNVNKPDEFLDRRAAEAAVGMKGTAEAGGLDSMDLPGAHSREMTDRFFDRLQEIAKKSKISDADKDQLRRSITGLKSAHIAETQEALASGKPQAEVVTSLRDELSKTVNFLYERTKNPKFKQALTELEKGPQDAIRELRTDQLSTSQPPRDIQAVEEEVRSRTDAQGEAQKEGEGTQLGSGVPPPKGLVDKIKDRLRLTPQRQFWMQTTGHLVEAEKGHYEKAREILGETGAGEARDTDANVKHVYNAMEQRGFTRFTEKGDKYVVDNAIGPRQLDAVNRLAAEKGKQVFDENGKMLRDFRYDIPGEVRLGSGIPIFDPALWKREYDKFKVGTLPAHVKANEHVANRMAEYAAADITTAVGGMSPTYKDNVLKSWKQAGINAGLYSKTAAAGMTRISDLGLWVRNDLAGEVNQAVRNRGLVQQGVYEAALNSATAAQLIGPVDFGSHAGNLYSTVVGSPGKTRNFTTDQIARLYGVRHLDALVRIGMDVYKAIHGSPAVQRDLTRISALGALRGVHPRETIVSKLTGGIIDFDKWIKNIDRGARLSLDKMFSNMVRQGLTQDTPVNRREFINQGGQYLDKLMSENQEWMRNHFSQFVVAGRTMNKNAVKRWALVNQVREASPAAYVKMKVSNLVAAVSTWLVVPVLVNMAITGKPFGRAGTPIGKVDLGTDDPDGRHRTLDLAKMDLSRRGARITGSEALIEGVRQGQKPGRIAANMVISAANGALNPWIGPPARVVETLRKEYDASHRADEAIKQAALALNPLLPNVAEEFGLEETARQKPLTVLEKAGTIVGVGKGRQLRHTEVVGEAAGKPVEEMSLDERTKAERQYKLHAEKLPLMQKAAAAGRAVENSARRGQEAHRALSKADRQWLESRNLNAPGYDNKIRTAGVEVYLTDKETERLGVLIQSEYGDAITRLRKYYDSITDETERSKEFSEAMADAKERARGILRREMSDSPSESHRKGPPGLSMPTR